MKLGAHLTRGDPTLFLWGATAGVVGNATGGGGGRRGAIIGAFVHGILITFLPVFLLPVLGEIGFANTTFFDADFGVVDILLGKLAVSASSKAALGGSIAVILAILVVYQMMRKKQS